jgi:hypothetical protein
MSKRTELVQFGDLMREHFEAFPVWASCHSFDSDEEWFDETDEETFRPWTGPLPVDPSQGMFLLRSAITLRDGSVFKGFITHPSSHEPPNMGEIQPYLFLPDGEQFGFWFGTTHCDPQNRGAFYRALGKTASGVFPARFAVEPGLSSGAPVACEIEGFYWSPDLRVVKVET